MRHKKVRVIACSTLRSDSRAQMNRLRLIKLDQMPPTNIRKTTGRVKIPCRESLGGFFINSESGDRQTMPAPVNHRLPD